MANLLIVEDQQRMAQTLSTLLELEGHRVFNALERSEVLQAVGEDHIDLVLLDVYLTTENGQEVNGLEILDQIRRLPGGGDPIVIMTSGSDLRKQVIEAGADGFLMKPYMPERLLTLIQSHLAGAE
jgi:CheY-like chemotaxis protein